MTRRASRIPSSLHGNFQLPRALACALALGAAGCGDEAGGEPATCVNFDLPDVLKISDVTPTLDSTVPNQDIVHSFTVVSASGTFETLSFAYGPEHEAGAPTPSALNFEPMLSGMDMVYTFEKVTWEDLGRVELIETGEYSDLERCFILPRPLFAYDVTEVTE